MITSTMQAGDLTIPALFRTGMERYGDSEVVTMTDGAMARRSFAEIGGRASQLAAALRGLGVAEGDRVGTFQWNNAEHVEAYFAVPSMGSVLHTVNIRLAARQIAYVLSHAEDRVIIADASLLSALVGPLSEVSCVRHLIVVGAPSVELDLPGIEVHDYEALLAANPIGVDLTGPIDELAPAAMCYTSGTTGDPRGVVYSHRSTYLHAMAVCTGNFLALTDQDRVLTIVPMFHANAWGLPYAAWMAGADLLMPDRFMAAAPLCRFIAEERATVTAGVPTIWADILRLAEHEPVDFSSLRVLGSGGSAVPLSLLQGYRKRFGLDLIQGFGMTETSPMAAIGRPPKNSDPRDEWAWRVKTGRVMAGIDCRIVDEHGTVLGRDGKALGEIELRGAWVTGGYYLDTATEKFRDGWLRTGDIGTLDDRGYLSISDRTKDVIKSGGEWISSVELENELMGHPEVAEAAVVAIPDARWQERPLAFVVRRDGSQVTGDNLRTYLEGRVASWQVPEYWTFIDEIPRTSVGKFDKKVLRDRHAGEEFDVLVLG